MSWKNGYKYESPFPCHQQGFDSGVGWKSSVSAHCPVNRPQLGFELGFLHLNMQSLSVHLTMNNSFFTINPCETLTRSVT